MDGKLRMPETATYIPICRTEEEQPARLPRRRGRRRGAGRILLACTLIFACAFTIQRPDRLHTIWSKAVSLTPMLETLGSKTRRTVQAFVGLQEPAAAVSAGTQTVRDVPDVVYYGESAVPVWAVTTAPATTAATTAATSTTATTAAASTTPAVSHQETVSSDPETVADWPDIVTASVRVPAFDYTLPLAGVITSDFGYRDHPVDGELKFHYGVDIAGSEGTPIAAFADGTVIYTGVGEINGNYIKIRHADGYVSLYAHMSEICVEWGETVKKGDTVGLVGQTGTVTGPHLHLQLYHDGLLFDPVLLLGDSLGV